MLGLDPKCLPMTLLLLAGCGPRLVTLEGGETSGATSSASTDETTTSESESTSETTDEPPTTTNETTTTFVPEFMDVMPASCSTFQQDCPDGEKCVAYVFYGSNWDAAKCVPIMGSQATGEDCWSTGPVEATDNCDATGFCWNVDDQGNGTCHSFCTGTPDDPMCPESYSCQIASDSPLSVCIRVCNPLQQDCDEGTTCYWANNGFTCLPTGADIPTGEPCGYINDCVAGDVCVDATVLPDCAGSACCVSFCDIDLGPAPCESVLPGTECVAFFELGMAPPGYANLGVCIVP